MIAIQVSYYTERESKTVVTFVDANVTSQEAREMAVAQVKAKDEHFDVLKGTMLFYGGDVVRIYTGPRP